MALAVSRGGTVNAAQIVMGLARELNTDKIELPGFPGHRRPHSARTGGREHLRQGRREAGCQRAGARGAARAARQLRGIQQVGPRDQRSEGGDQQPRLQHRAQPGDGVRHAPDGASRNGCMPIRPVLADIWKTSNGVAALCFRGGEARAGCAARRVHGDGPVSPHRQAVPVRPRAPGEHQSPRDRATGRRR